jgi:hypothetical protein
VRLPYSVLPAAPNSAFPDRSSISRPLVGLLLEKNGRQAVVFALIDSGADSCVFPASVADSLGIAIPNDRAAAFSGSKNEVQIAYYEQIQATILDMDSPGSETNQETITFPLDAGFCDTLEHVGMGLLGQEGFFSLFSVHFHASQQFFEICA